MAAPKEGVTRYELTGHETRPLPIDMTSLATLNRYRTYLHFHNLIGQDASGVGFGNISERFGPKHKLEEGTDGLFIVSATQTGEPRNLPVETGYTLITGLDIAANRVTGSIGPQPPSSETMTHAALYRDKRVGAVAHGHSQVIFDMADVLDLPCTPKHIEYGTPEMAEAIWDVYTRENVLEGRGIIVMKGHKGGVITMGANPRQAAITLGSHLYVSRNLARQI